MFFVHRPGTKTYAAVVFARWMQMLRLFWAVLIVILLLGTGLWLLPKSRATAEHAAVLVPVVAPAAGGPPSESGGAA